MAIINGELSTAIIQDPDALTILTDLFDRNYNAKWDNMLKGDGVESLKDPYFTCLFGSSPAHFYDSIPQPNIEGGYIGRNLIIYEETRSKDTDLLDPADESQEEDRFMTYIVPKYVPHLLKISANKIKMTVEETARVKFNLWRKNWRNSQSQYGDRTGFVNRVPDHILKVAMCLCLARYDTDCCISDADIAESTEKILTLIYSSRKAAEGSGLDPLAAQTKKIVDFLIAAVENKMSRRELLVKGYGNYDEIALDKICETLMEMQWIKKERQGFGANLDYMIHLSGEPKERYLQFKASMKQERV